MNECISIKDEVPLRIKIIDRTELQGNRPPGQANDQPHTRFSSSSGPPAHNYLPLFNQKP